MRFLQHRLIIPQVLSDAIAQGGDVAKRAFEAMLTMQKIDVVVIQVTVDGKTLN